MLDNITDTIMNVVTSVRLMDAVDIAIVAFAIYKIIGFISRTRTQQIVKGLLVLVAALVLSDLLDLYTVHFILNYLLTYGVMAIIVIFYPELRRALEYLGRNRLFSSRQFSANAEKDSIKEMISQISSAVEFFASNKVGALIIIERNIALGDIVEKGTRIDAEVTSILLMTIFFEGTTLHDGAVIIRDDRLCAAGCVLPLSENNSLERTLGTRHRAAVGITEVSDAIAIIVSEETGIISMASEGKLSRFLDTKTIEKTLYNIYLSGIDSSGPSDIVMNIFRRRRNDDKEK